MKQTAFLAQNKEAYQQLDLKKGKPEIWEDGMRTHGGKGSFEWWYFDAHLTDGSKVVIVFYTKPMTGINKPVAAYATFNIDYADGSKLERYLPSPVFSAASDRCDITIGKCRFQGDLNTYQIYMEGFDFICEVEFKAEAESWRPETGHLYFGGHDHHFGWLVAVPKGKVNIKYTINGQTIATSGTGYHDHNWGNTSLHKIINHWYWTRAEFGPYTLIASQIIPEKKFGAYPVNLVYILKNGKMIADDPSFFELFRSFPNTGGIGNKPISNELIFNYNDTSIQFNVHLRKKTNLIETYLIQQEPQRKLIKLLTGFNGAYFRITGEGILTVLEKNGPQEIFRNEHAIWELMYFGKPL